MYKIAHIADTHIKNLKFHYEYKIVFEQLYETLRKENVDYIVHCGDIAHTKTQISPEFVELCSDFFLNLASIAPTYIILISAMKSWVASCVLFITYVITRTICRRLEWLLKPTRSRNSRRLFTTRRQSVFNMCVKMRFSVDGI